MMALSLQPLASIEDCVSKMTKLLHLPDAIDN
jgi:hypothetical protein